VLGCDGLKVEMMLMVVILVVELVIWWWVDEITGRGGRKRL